MSNFSSKLSESCPRDSAKIGLRLRGAARWLLRQPLFRRLKPIVQKVRAVAEPASLLHRHRQTEATASSECRTLTVLSANLWHDFPRYRNLSERLEAFARLAETEGADVLLLQEVSRTSWLHADTWLAERLKMTSVYTRANGQASAIGFEEGLAVLSRFPLTVHHLRQLSSSTNPFVRRLALGAEVFSPCGPFLAFSVHLGLIPRQNAGQIWNLHHWISQVAGNRTALVGGDFNAHETARRLQPFIANWLDTFRHLYPHADGTTHTLRWPWGTPLKKHRLDYIFLRNGHLKWYVMETLHLQTNGLLHSDHHAVLTRLAVTA